MNYMPLGPPSAPRLRVSSIDLQSITLEWHAPQYARPDYISGYQLIINSEYKQIFEKDVNEFVFTDMQPNQKYDIQIVTLTNETIGRSEPSNVVTLVCPHKPPAPVISQLPTVRPNSIVVGWRPSEPRSSNNYDRALFYKLSFFMIDYFLSFFDMIF
jgi:hypothetical protein